MLCVEIGVWVIISKWRLKWGSQRRAHLSQCLEVVPLGNLGRYFPGRWEFRDKCPMQRCHVPRTRIPLPQPLTPYDLKGRNYQESRKWTWRRSNCQIIFLYPISGLGFCLYFQRRARNVSKCPVWRKNTMKSDIMYLKNDVWRCEKWKCHQWKQRLVGRVDIEEKHDIYYIIVCVCSVALSGLTPCDPMDCSPPGSSVHGIFQARILEWVALSYFRGSSQLRDWTGISCIGKQILCHCATWEVQGATLVDR